jgi:hypothetical protein
LRGATRTNDFGPGYFDGFARTFGTCALVASVRPCASESVQFIYEVGESDACGFGTENVRAGKAGLVDRRD